MSGDKSAFRGRNVCSFEGLRQDLVRINRMQRVSAAADVKVVNARWWDSPFCFSICLHNDECVHVEVDTWRYVSGVSLGPS